MALSFRERIQRANRRLRSLQLVGGPGVQIEGVPGRFAMNSKKEEEETPIGACCIGTDCSILTQDQCTALGGTYLGDDTDCTASPCLPTGACCIVNHVGGDGSCITTTEIACLEADGTWEAGIACCTLTEIIFTFRMWGVWAGAPTGTCGAIEFDCTYTHTFSLGGSITEICGQIFEFSWPIDYPAAPSCVQCESEAASCTSDLDCVPPQLCIPSVIDGRKLCIDPNASANSNWFLTIFIPCNVQAAIPDPIEYDFSAQLLCNNTLCLNDNSLLCGLQSTTPGCAVADNFFLGAPYHYQNDRNGGGDSGGYSYAIDITVS